MKADFGFDFFGMYILHVQDLCEGRERDQYQFLILFLLHFCVCVFFFFFWDERGIKGRKKIHIYRYF